MSDGIISAIEFEERLGTLCLNPARSGFPRRHRDRHILFRSVVQTLDPAKDYSEPILKEALQTWLSDVGSFMDMDHVTLRRYLVDAGYVRRDPEGRRYMVSLSGRGHVEFEEAIVLIDSSIVVHAARQEAAARKRSRSTLALKEDSANSQE